MIGWRNYPVASQSRDSIVDSPSYGLHAVNSEIEFERGHHNEYTGDGLRAFQFNRTGIKLVNSVLKGGGYFPVTTNLSYRGENDATQSTIGGPNDHRTHWLNTSYNNVAGAHLENSTLDWKGRLQSYCNEGDGLLAEKSKIKTNTFAIDDNGGNGIHLKNSSMEYGSYANLTNGIVMVESYEGNTDYYEKRPAFCVTNNFQNLVIENSSHFNAKRFTPMHHFYGTDKTGAMMGGRAELATNSPYLSVNHGSAGFKYANGGDTKQAFRDFPAAFVDNNSSAELLTYGHKANTSKGAIKGSGGAAYRNSTLRLVCPSKAFDFNELRCVITDENDCTSEGNELTHLETKWTSCGLYGGKNSSVEITGPTKISRLGICVLVEDNSTFTASPPYKKSSPGGPRQVDTEVFDTSAAYCHTGLMLHAARACLVANRQSSLNLNHVGGKLVGLGYYHFDGQNGDGNTLLNPDDFQDGFVSFLPNAFDSGMLDEEFAGQLNCKDWATASERSGPSFTQLIAEVPQMTTGGMCVRAVDNSQVNVDTVAFAVGYDNYSLSGAYYNLYGSGMEHKGGYNGGNPEETEVQDGSHVFMPDFVYPPYGYTDPLSNKNGYYDPNNQNNRFPTAAGSKGGYGVGGSQILIWNICDTSRVKCEASHAVGLKLNGGRETFETWEFGKPANDTGNQYNYHGPYGVWHNGAALDFYGTSGYAMSAISNTLAGNQKFGGEYISQSGRQGVTPNEPGLNQGMFRLFLGTRGDVKQVAENNMFYNTITEQYEMSSIGWASALGGSPMHQLNAQGYMSPYPAAASLEWAVGVTHTPGYSLWEQPYSTRNDQLAKSKWGEHYEVWGYGNFWDSDRKYAPAGSFPQVGPGTAGDAPYGVSSLDYNAFPLGVVSYSEPRMPLHTAPGGFARNFLDQEGANLFANAKHLAHYMVGGVSIYLSTIGYDPLAERGTDARSQNNMYRGGEGSSTKWGTAGAGVRSTNLFDLGKML